MKFILVIALTLIVQSAHALQPNDDRRWLSCLVSSMGPGGAGDVFVQPLKDVPAAQSQACKADQFCGANKNDYLVQGDIGQKTPTLRFGRYDIYVNVLVDYSISNLEILDTKKGISMAMMSPSLRVPEYGDANPTEQGHSFEVYIYQREKALPSYDVSCSVYKEGTAKDLGDVGKKITAILNKN